ncbi:MAG: hypothetical protein F7B17_06755 [Desulfurococcales archaeon]|nr:hypothetical protein [Desulfurococcales archaeon]
MIEFIIRELEARGYRVKGVIAESGSYVVLKALSSSNETVAIKVPRELALRGVTLSESSLLSAVERAWSEIEVLNALKGDPGVITLIDVIEVKISWSLNESISVPLAVVEYAESTLASMIRDGRGSWEFYVRALAQTAKALEHAHSLGFCHLDVRPENILIVKGKPKLSDFAGRCDESPKIIPPVGFAAPEQLEAGGKTGPWTDVYQLAVTYLSLLGVKPTEVRVEDLPRTLARALSREPSKRPSMRELREFLEREASKTPLRLEVKVEAWKGRLMLKVPVSGGRKARSLVLSRGLEEPRSGTLLSLDGKWATLPGGLEPGVYTLWIKSGSKFERVGLLSVPEEPCFSEECFNCEVKVEGESGGGRFLTAALGAGLGYLAGLAVAGLLAAVAMALIFAAVGAGVGGLAGAIISLARGESGFKQTKTILYSAAALALAFAVIGVGLNFPQVLQSVRSAADAGSTIGLLAGAFAGYKLAPHAARLTYKYAPSLAGLLSFELQVKGAYSVRCGRCRPQVIEVAGSRIALAPRSSGSFRGSLPMPLDGVIEAIEYILRVPKDSLLRAEDSLKISKTTFKIEEIESRGRRWVLLPASRS